MTHSHSVSLRSPSNRLAASRGAGVTRSHSVSLRSPSWGPG